MTDKEKLIKIKELADAMYVKMQYLTTDTSGIRKAMEEYHQFLIYEYYKEEPVSEFPNTESMIESYKQRLISQVNGVKNSPLIDMCLTSYKHGINETLDALNLSNVERTVKDRKEPVSKDLEEAAVNAFKQIVDSDKNNFLEIFKAGAKWQKQQIMGVVQKYADKGHHMYNDFEDDDISDTSELSYWDGFLSCAECIKREL